MRRWIWVCLFLLSFSSQISALDECPSKNNLKNTFDIYETLSLEYYEDAVEACHNLYLHDLVSDKFYSLVEVFSSEPILGKFTKSGRSFFIYHEDFGAYFYTFDSFSTHIDMQEFPGLDIADIEWMSEDELLILANAIEGTEAFIYSTLSQSTIPVDITSFQLDKLAIGETFSVALRSKNEEPVIWITNLATRTSVELLVENDHYPIDVEFIPGTDRFLLAYQDGSVEIWHAPTAKLLNTLNIDEIPEEVDSLHFNWTEEQLVISEYPVGNDGDNLIIKEGYISSLIIDLNQIVPH